MNPDDVPDGPLLVDTDVISYWLLGDQRGHAFTTLAIGHDMAVSFATYGELLANLHRKGVGERRLGLVRERLRPFVVVPYNIDVVELWAQMHAKVSGHLHRGGTNDLWTAACALSVRPRLPVVTNNRKDFEAITASFSDLQLIHPDL